MYNVIMIFGFVMVSLVHHFLPLFLKFLLLVLEAYPCVSPSLTRLIRVRTINKVTLIQFFLPNKLNMKR